jgi:ubiquinone/menaquinone biosynthesis C-methylase UbiE
VQPFDSIAREYQDLHSRNPHQLVSTEELAALLVPNAKILDLGCGTGVPTAKLLAGAGCKVIGVDHADGMLELARAQVPGASFIKADLRAVSFDNDEFDAIVALFSLLMLPKFEIERMLSSIHGWLKPDAYFLLGMVNFDGDSIPVSFLGTEFNASGYKSDELRRVLDAARFRVLRFTTADYEVPGQPSEAQIFILCQRSNQAGSNG